MNMYVPAATIVAEWSKALTVVGPVIAVINHSLKGSCADFVNGPIINVSINISVPATPIWWNRLLQSISDMLRVPVKAYRAPIAKNIGISPILIVDIALHPPKLGLQK